jgi:hypothetical protein
VAAAVVVEGLGGLAAPASNGMQRTAPAEAEAVARTVRERLQPVQAAYTAVVAVVLKPTQALLVVPVPRVLSLFNTLLLLRTSLSM